MKYIKKYRLFEEEEEPEMDEMIEIMSYSGDVGFEVTEDEFLELLELGFVDYDDKFRDENYQKIADYLDMIKDMKKYNL